MHLVITTREDPPLPLARYRGRGQLTELRAADLRFTSTEAADFLNRMMGLNLSDADIAALEACTEGWIAGLQMAAISMQGLPDAANFIQSFTGSHRFVLDYLLEEVLHRQPVKVQTFLLRTSILDRMCGPLCDAVIGNMVIRDSLPGTREEAGSFLPESRNISNTPTCSLFPWITSGVGTAIIIFLSIYYASDWGRISHLEKSPNCTSTPASGMKITTLGLKHSNMPPPPMISNALSA
jgi:hypothetical protein